MIGITEFCFMGVNIFSTLKFYVNVDKRDILQKYNQPIDIIIHVHELKNTSNLTSNKKYWNGTFKKVK